MIRIYALVALFALGLISLMYPHSIRRWLALMSETVPSRDNNYENDPRWIPRIGEPHAKREKWECGQWDGVTFHRIECPGGG
jgi:hypothetical protein